MDRIECDVGIIGAGVAGLTAAAELARTGLDVQIVEASERIGGRILTVHDPLSPLPIELGAEFVHGRSPEIWDRVKTGNLKIFEHSARTVFVANGRIDSKGDNDKIAERVMTRMAKSERRSDETFDDYLHRSRDSAANKRWARIYVEGFNAARSDTVSVEALLSEAEAADEIDGDRTFRILDGYDAIPRLLFDSIPGHASVLHLNRIVNEVRWKRDRVDVNFTSATTSDEGSLRCRQLIVTVPLGVLQASVPKLGAIRFDPEPRRALQAARSLAFGRVRRVTFRFRDAFWEEGEQLQQVGFLISQDKGFFTWWTTHPVAAPLLTGWSAGSAVEDFEIPNPQAVAKEALASLGRILRRKIPTPEAYYFHDWQSDPFFRGAYSYVPVRANGARAALAKPEAETLFFSGEAANTSGHGSTVHGAIDAGRKTAAMILKSRRRAKS